MRSCDVACSFVLLCRTGKKIIKVKGDNCFSSGKKGRLHANIRKDFMETATGIARRDYKIVEAPKATKDIRNLEQTITVGHQIQFQTPEERVAEESSAMKPEDPNLAGVVEM